MYSSCLVAVVTLPACPLNCGMTSTDIPVVTQASPQVLAVKLHLLIECYYHNYASVCMRRRLTIVGLCMCLCVCL